MPRKAKFTELEGSPKALVGKDGWLFLTGDSNDVLGQHTGRVVPPRSWEREWARLWRRRARLMRHAGAEHVQLIVPDKESVYDDMLPDSVEPVARRPVHRLLDRARRAPVEVIYPLAELSAARTAGPVFARTDTHWTARGAYIAYRRVCDELVRRGLGVPVVGEDEIDWVEREAEGDLGVQLDPPRGSLFVDARLRDQRARLLEDNRVSVTGRRLVYEGGNADGPRWVVFGTSYAAVALAFLAESSSRLVFQHTTALVAETVREERPDAVILMTAERGLQRTPVDRGAAAMLAEVVAEKLAAGAVDDPPGWLGLPPPRDRSPLGA